MRKHFDQILQWVQAALFVQEPFKAAPAKTWSDETWFVDQENRNIQPNEGHWVMADGRAEGRLIGGNLCTLNLLHGTDLMSDLPGAIVFIEDDYESPPVTFDRDLTSLTQQPGFDEITGLLIGRFQREVAMNRDILAAILASKRELDGLPIVANMDFGHTEPILTMPVGGNATLSAAGDTSDLTLG